MGTCFWCYLLTFPPTVLCLSSVEIVSGIPLTFLATNKFKMKSEFSSISSIYSVFVCIYYIYWYRYLWNLATLPSSRNRALWFTSFICVLNYLIRFLEHPDAGIICRLWCNIIKLLYLLTYYYLFILNKSTFDENDVFVRANESILATSFKKSHLKWNRFVSESRAITAASYYLSRHSAMERLWKRWKRRTKYLTRKALCFHTISCSA